MRSEASTLPSSARCQLRLSHSIRHIESARHGVLHPSSCPCSAGTGHNPRRHQAAWINRRLRPRHYRERDHRPAARPAATERKGQISPVNTANRRRTDGLVATSETVVLRSTAGTAWRAPGHSISLVTSITLPGSDHHGYGCHRAQSWHRIAQRISLCLNGFRHCLTRTGRDG